MTDQKHTNFHNKVSAAGLLVATGIVFGDIGTSPLYTYTAVFHEGEITERGTHDELIAMDGRYKRLHSMQMF